MTEFEDIRAMCASHAAQEVQGAFTAAEARFLAEREPHTQLRPITAKGISAGRQSRVTVLAYERDGHTRHVMWKRMGANKQLTRAEATSMWTRLDHYKAALEATGWIIPHLLYSTVVEVPTNGPRSPPEAQIFSYEQYIPGGDCDAMLSDPTEPDFRKWHFVTEVIRTLYAYPEDQLRRTTIAGRTLTLLPHGLDLKAANFVMEQERNRLYFVDLFGPKELDKEGRWRIYLEKIDPLPPDNLRAVCATREGAILRFWRLARRLWHPEKTARRRLTAELLERLHALEPPEAELNAIRREIETDYPWMNALYSERQV